MGRISDALTPYLPQFCEDVDPEELMRELMTSLRNCDWVGVQLFDTTFLFASVLDSLF